MTETKGSKVSEIRRVDDSHIRLREDTSDRKSRMEILSNRKARRSFDNISYRWLDQNYTRIYGLRNWTWRTII